MRYTVAIVVWSIVAIGCVSEPQVRNPTTRATRVSSFPALGEPIADTSAVKIQAMVSSGRRGYQAYELECNGLLLSIGADDDDIIRYIATEDPTFATPEGYQVGTPYRVIKSQVGEAMEQGNCYAVPLPSGWNAAFKRGLTKQPFPHAPVIWFYKHAIY